MQRRAILDPTRLVRLSALALLLGASGPVRAAGPPQDGTTAIQKPPSAVSPRARVSRRVIRAKAVSETPPAVEPAPLAVETPENAPPVDLPARAGAAGAAVLPKVEVTETEIRTDPPVTPGSRLALEAGRNFEGARFHWVQVEGPTVEVPDPSRASIQVLIPSGTAKLGFILVAARPELVRLVRVSVPIRNAGVATVPRASWGSLASGKVKADAGDDQVGLVGHRVTLNGSRSLPSDGKGARWIQAGGPDVQSPEQQGVFFSFIPVSPGTYRFLLVVASQDEVSEPDEVSVLVGAPPVAAAPAAASALPAPAFTPAPPVLNTPEQILASTLPRLPDAARISSEIADVMEAVAERSALYTSFAVLQNELVRRLDVVVPAEPSQRASWAQDVFYPLTTYTANQLRSSGLDLSNPRGFQQTLTVAQQEQLHDHLLKMARAFRASVASR